MRTRQNPREHLCFVVYYTWTLNLSFHYSANCELIKSEINTNSGKSNYLTTLGDGNSVRYTACNVSVTLFGQVLANAGSGYNSKVLIINHF